VDEGRAAARGDRRPDRGGDALTLLAVAVGGRGVVDPAEPVLRADDEALLRGRAAFETIRVYANVPFRLAEHLDRLATSAERIGLPAVNRLELEELARQALEAAGTPDAVLRLFWTPTPTSLALVTALADHYDALRERGQRLISLRGIRADEPWLLPGVKSTSYAVNMAAEGEAKRRGADDAVFVDADGTVLEGPTTNIWWRSGRTLHTPSLELGILAGVTRAAVIELAAGVGYEVAEGDYPLDELTGAEEAFTSSSVREVMPVVELDGTPIPRGPAADELQAALRRAAQATLSQ
jgi:4-amino-4-deoxychorismate lyase